MRRRTQRDYFIFWQLEHAVMKNNCIGEGQSVSKKGTCSGLRSFQMLVIMLLLAGVWGNTRAQVSFLPNDSAAMARLYLSTNKDLIGVKNSFHKNANTSNILRDSCLSFQFNSQRQDFETVANNKEVFIYNNDQLLINYLQYNPNGIDWLLKKQIIYSYNTRKLNDTTILMSFIDDAELGIYGWVNINRTIQEYNPADNKTKYIVQNWNTELNVWENNWQHIFYYKDIYGTLDSIVEQKWEAGNWVHNYLYSYKFANYLKTEEITSQYNVTSSLWIPSFKSNYSYLNGNNDSIISKQWNINTASWDEKALRTYIYNEINAIEEYSDFDWKDANWILSGKGNYNFNTLGLKAYFIAQQFDTISKSWKNNWEETYLYDSSANEIETSFKNWSRVSNNWSSGIRKNFYYSYHSIITKVNSFNNKMDIYPNPTSGMLFFNFEKDIKEIRIINLSGSEYMKVILPHPDHIDISNLASGMYIFDIRFKDGVVKRNKILKK